MEKPQVGDTVKIRSNDDFNGKTGTVTKVIAAIVLYPVEVWIPEYDYPQAFAYSELVVITKADA